MTEHASWIAGARPTVPALVRARLEGFDGREPPGATGLLEEGLAALERSLSAERLERGGAFTLLAADALLTWAAEAALDGGDPAATLKAMVLRIAEAGEARNE